MTFANRNSMNQYDYSKEKMRIEENTQRASDRTSQKKTVTFH
jgi:hypothetical protein